VESSQERAMPPRPAGPSPSSPPRAFDRAPRPFLRAYTARPTSDHAPAPPRKALFCHVQADPCHNLALMCGERLDFDKRRPKFNRFSSKDKAHPVCVHENAACGDWKTTASG